MPTYTLAIDPQIVTQINLLHQFFMDISFVGEGKLFFKWRTLKNVLFCISLIILADENFIELTCAFNDNFFIHHFFL
jgi:hypothetical protein